MNTKYLLKQIRPYVKDNRLTYDDFDKIFGFLERREQYQIVDALHDDLKIKLVDEIDSPPEEEEIPDEDELPAEIASFIVRKPHEIKVPNKFLIRLIQNGDKQARQDLCIKNSGLVGKFAVKYIKKFPCKLTLEDLMQEGFIGMLTAAEKFDLSKDTAFSTYATWWIMQAIGRAIIDTGFTVRLPVHIVEKIWKATKLDRNFQLQDIELRKRLELIAAEMETTSDEIRKFFKLRDIYRQIVSLDMPVGEDSDTPLADFIPDDDAQTPEDSAIFILLKEQLDEALSALKPREKEVLILRFGLQDGRDRTLEEVGKILSVTRERIRQIEAKALRKLRHPAHSKKLSEFLT